MTSRLFRLAEEREREQRAADEAAALRPDEGGAPRPCLTPDTAASLQRTIGNAAVARLVAAAGNPALVHPLGMVGPDGKVGEAPFIAVDPHAHPAPVIEQVEKNEFGEIDGEVTTNAPSCLFIDGGKVGEGKVYWVAGGTGGQGQQNVGSIDLVAPEYEGVDGSGTEKAKAWIKPGTGKATVTRTFKGVVLGDNGPYYFTAKAVARADVHEKLHVKASKVEHDRSIAPLEQRIALHTGQDKALSSGATKAEAIAALKTLVDWNAAITAFQTADITQNQGGGTVDTLDMADPTFVKNYGPRTIDGKHFDAYLDQEPGPPAATPSPTGGSAVGTGS